MKKQKPIMELFLTCVFLISLTVFIIMNIKNKDTQKQGNTIANNDEQLMNADPEDADTYKRLYMFSQELNKATFFKYQVGNIGDKMYYYGTFERPGLHKDSVIYSGKSCLQVISAEILDAYQDRIPEAGNKFVRVTAEIENVSDKDYIWDKSSVKAYAMDEEGAVMYQYDNKEYGIGELKEWAAEYEPGTKFYMDWLNHDNLSASEYIECSGADTEGCIGFLLYNNSKTQFSMIYEIPENVIESGKLAWGSTIAVKRKKSSVVYTNLGVSVCLFPKSEEGI